MNCPGSQSDGLEFHHVGMVVPQIEPVADFYEKVLGYTRQGPVIEDPVQKVRIQFLELHGFTLELLEPLGEQSPVARFMKAGGGLNHICYACNDIEAELRRFKSKGLTIACVPTPAPAIESRKVAFVVSRNREVIELVEKDKYPYPTRPA